MAVATVPGSFASDPRNHPRRHAPRPSHPAKAPGVEPMHHRSPTRHSGNVH